jgi:ABC-type uncharacterized transport system involved in gliding motility auxiliary subunit
MRESQKFPVLSNKEVYTVYKSVSVDVRTCHVLPVMPVLLENKNLEKNYVQKKNLWVY